MELFGLGSIDELWVGACLMPLENKNKPLISLIAPVVGLFFVHFC